MSIGDIALVRTASYSSNHCVQGVKDTTPLPSAVQLPVDSDSSQSWSQQDLDSISLASNPKSCNRIEKTETTITSNSTPIDPITTSVKSTRKPSSSFFPMQSDEPGDEWGQFADFDDLEEESYTFGDDPFKSISKSILKKRGDFSFQKLDQLQEEEEEEEDDR